MSHLLFELLENSGFIKGTTINAEQIGRAKRSRLVDVALQSADLTPASAVSNQASIFSHTSSLSLSGGPLPCSSIDCRLDRANQLAQFAAFYSDRVFMNNGLFTCAKKIHRANLDIAKYAFHNELEVLVVLRPLIESGLIIPVTPTTTKCFHCLGKSALSVDDATKFDRALNRFTTRFSKEAEVKLEYVSHGEVTIHVTGHDDLVEHGSSHVTLGHIKKLADEQPRLVTRLKKEGTVILPKSVRKIWGIDGDFAHVLFDDIGFEMAVSQCLKTSVVSSRPIHIDILKDVVRSDELNRRNALIQKHLTCLVPFLGKVSSSELLALRDAESDAFISFRQAFCKAVDEHIKAKHGKLSERDAVAIYNDVLEPELARLNQKVNSASKSLFKKSRAGILGWVAAISAGHYFGFLDSGLIATAKALGLTKVAADLAAGLMASSGEDAIRNENMYFLWKVRHRAERN